MKSPWLKILPLLIGFIFLAACGNDYKIGNVQIDIVACGPAASDSEVKFTLRYTNENVFAMAIGETRGRLYLNGEYIGSYVIADPVGLPQLGSVSKQASLKIEKPGVLQRVRNSPATAVAYRLETVMRLQVSEERLEIKTLSTGQLETAAFRVVPAK